VSNGEETSVVSSLGTLETEDITGYVISIWKHVIMLDIFFPEGVCHDRQPDKSPVYLKQHT
jgi:hypothetical protein